jgi:RND family efflux transporter MFP subunit
MKRIINISLIFFFTAVISSCGTSDRKNNALAEKKAQFQKLKSEKENLDEKILSLQKEIVKLDTASAIPVKPQLVALTTVEKTDFKHYLDLQGTVDAKNISYITPTGQGGQIKAIYVKQGDKVHQGQLILKLDDAVMRENVAAIRQQMGSVKAQLDLAKSVYERQSNLWAQHIGTEVQLLQAKTNVETLENQLKSIQAQVNTAQEQANQSNVYSNVNGVVDDITAHVGETFTGNPLAGGYIKIVNQSDLKITVTVPENYAGKVHKGSKVIVKMPDVDKTFDSEVTFISQAIGTTTRGFTAEIRVPKGLALRPNQISLVQILDYTAPNTITAPLNTLQTDENGKYVLVAIKEGDKMVARKRKVTIGELYNDMIEIKEGLQPGDQLITEGYQGVFDGQLLTVNG